MFKIISKEDVSKADKTALITGSFNDVLDYAFENMTVDLDAVSHPEDLAKILDDNGYHLYRVVNNLMSQKPVDIELDTPLCCDPSSETYWSM